MTDKISAGAHKITIGTILIHERAFLPDSLDFESENYASGWRSVQHLDAYSLDRRIRATGWSFFSIAPEIKVNVLGFGGAMTVLRAVKRIIAKLKGEPFNCFDITELRQRNFLGIPYLHVSAHPRRIQERPYLHRPRKELGERDRARLSAAGQRA